MAGSPAESRPPAGELDIRKMTRPAAGLPPPAHLSGGRVCARYSGSIKSVPEGYRDNREDIKRTSHKDPMQWAAKLG